MLPIFKIEPKNIFKRITRINRRFFIRWSQGGIPDLHNEMTDREYKGMWS